MIHIERWKVIAICAVCALAILYSLPNVMPKSGQNWMAQNLPGWLPTKTINLGLDLQGGSHLLLEADTGMVIRERADDLLQAARTDLRKEKIRYSRLSANKSGINVRIREAGDSEKVKSILRGLDNEILVSQSNESDLTISASFSDDAIKRIQDQTIQQSIEIIRRRIDETGTREPVIQRQGDVRIIVQLPGVDDPQRIKDILGRTAKLSFHLVDTGRANLRDSGGFKDLPMAEDTNRNIRIQRRAMLNGDMLTNAQPSFQEGLPVVSFQLNGIGARRFCKVTSDQNNIGQPFAIVLDDQVISAPSIREPICGGSAVISGSFSVEEANDLSLLLRAGALPAPLNVMEERSVGPSLGADSVEAGKIASIVALFLVLVFMALSYGRFGLMADVALVVNVALIFALLSGLQATLTLPGIAGIVLTIGMAVDANVLIFERIREEIRLGRSPMSAIDAGYSRAMSTIIDSNLTTLIAAIMLFSFGTGPIKGFAVTLGIGIVTSFFSAIMITRLLVVTWLHKTKPKALSI